MAQKSESSPMSRRQQGSHSFHFFVGMDATVEARGGRKGK